MEENNNDSFERTVQREKLHIHSMPFIWLFSLIGGVVFFIFDRTWCFDYFLGVVASMLGLTMMLAAVNSTKIEHLKRAMIINYFIRYMLYGVVLALVWLVDGIEDVWTTLVGITLVKAVMLAYALIHKGEKV